MKKSSRIYFFVFILFFLNSTVLQAQIFAPGSSGSTPTNYPVTSSNDSIFIFCVDDEFAEIGALTVQTELAGSKIFSWEKYNNTTGDWEPYSSESTEADESTISSLANGGYRVTITQGETTEIHSAWVFNSWLSATAEITESTCDYFQLEGAFSSGEMKYYDPANNAEIDVMQNIQVQWNAGETAVAAVISPRIGNPPAEDTDYTLRVYDQFGCEATALVRYESIVTEAKFRVEYVDQSVGDTEIEAPLTVNFINESVNGDPGLFEWFFFRDLGAIKRETENSDQPVDSIMLVAYDDNPVYTYENTGTYNVKLVSKNVSEEFTCVDTFYIEELIVVDSAFVEAPNVFTPNGDGANDEFIIKFFSMRSVKISIFNRWGKRVHYWENGNVRGFNDSQEESVWDGRIGGRRASPGVYYYTVEGNGRDGRKRRAHGFFHLFTDKR